MHKPIPEPERRYLYEWSLVAMPKLSAMGKQTKERRKNGFVLIAVGYSEMTNIIFLKRIYKKFAMTVLLKMKNS